MKQLTDREKLVLEAVVNRFITTANPVASGQVAKFGYFNFSPATIRNIMASLEEKGYIYQPHTSAGRVPTSAGYRLYVDHLMKRGRLTTAERDIIRRVVSQNPGDFENLLKEATRILARLSRQLGVLVSPHLQEGIFHRLDITRLSSDRILLILSIKSGLVKTITIELRSGISDRELQFVEQVLNERLHGLKLHQIREDLGQIVRDLRRGRNDILDLMIRNASRLFDFTDDSDVYVTGTQHILRQPEFSDRYRVSRVVEVLEDKNVIVHLLDDSTSQRGISVRIGDEIGEQKMSHCSLIAARYRIGEVAGSLGIIGPMRMNYGHLIALVDYTANLLSSSFEPN